jgi:hypothetical protein
VAAYSPRAHTEAHHSPDPDYLGYGFTDPPPQHCDQRERR